MGFATNLLIFAGVFALAIGLIGCFIGSSENEKRKQRAEHESRRYARQPWDDADGRSNR